MKKFLKFFFAIILSVFLFSSCSLGKSGENNLPGGTTEVDLVGENAKFVFSIDINKASFLVDQIKRIIPKDDSIESKKSRELLEKLKNSSITVSSLSVFDDNNNNISNIEEPTAIMASNIDKEIISFFKDFKNGAKAELDENAKNPNELFESSKTISEFFKKGEEIGKSFKKSLENSSEEDKKRSIKVIDDMKIGDNYISLLFNPETGKEKLKGLLKDNKGFNEIIKNLKGDEFFYVYGSGDAIKDISSGQPSMKNLDIDSLLVGASINKTGAYINMYYKVKKDITKEEDESFKKEIETMNAQLKQMVKMYSGFLTASLEDADKKTVTDSINSLNVKYNKISSKSFSVKFSFETEVEKLFGILEKLSKTK